MRSSPGLLEPVLGAFCVGVSSFRAPFCRSALAPGHNTSAWAADTDSEVRPSSRQAAIDSRKTIPANGL